MSEAVPYIGQGLILFGGVYAFVGYVILAIYAFEQADKAKKLARRKPPLEFEDRNLTVRQPIGTHKIVYGQSRVGGLLTFLHTTDSNLYLHMVVTLTGHEVQAISDVYLDDVLIHFDESGNVIGKYANDVLIKKGLGTTAGDSDFNTALQANCPGKWTTNHRQSGRAKLYVRLKFNPELFANIPNVSAVVMGKKVYDPRTATTYWTNNAALCLRDYMLNTVTGLGATSTEYDETTSNAQANTCDERITVVDKADTFTAIKYTAPPVAPTLINKTGGFIEAGEHTYAASFITESGETTAINTALIDVIVLGSTAGGSVSVENIPIGGPGVIGRVLYRSTTGTTALKLLVTIHDNTTTTYIDIKADTSLGAAPANSIFANTIRHSGDLYFKTGDGVQLTTTGTLPGGLAPTTTYYYIFLNKTIGRLATSIANAFAGTAITITDAGSGTHTVTKKNEARYQLDGVIDTADKPKEILGGMLTAMSGKMCYVNGTWKLYAGTYRSPTITLDENDLDGPIKVQARLSRRDLFNRVRGVFINPAKHWQPDDMPAVTNATYLSEDGGEQIWRDIDLPFTTSVEAAQRIGKIQLEAARQQMTVVLQCKLSAMRVQAGDVVNVSNTRFGWSAKAFEVVDFKFAIRNDNDNPRLGIDLVLRETASTVYDWNSGEETTIDPAPNTSLPNPFVAAPPTGLTISSGTAYLYKRNDGTIFSRMYLQWTAPADAFVTGSGGQIEIEYKKTTDTSYGKAPPVTGSTTSAYILDVQDTVAYDVRIRSVNQLGTRSAWHYPVAGSHTVIGKTAPPADVTTFSAQQNGAVVTFRWSQVPDVDLAGYELRYMASPFVWNSAIVLTSVTRGTLVTNTGLPPGNWIAGIKARDTSGNYSTNATTFAVTVTSVFDIVSNKNQAALGWPGVRTNFVKHDVSNTLIPDSQTLASAMTDVELWDTFVHNPYATPYYETAELDLGFDTKVRVWSDRVAALGPGATGVADPQFYIDYRLAAGSYDGFENWTVGVIDARYIKSRVQIDTATGVAYVSGFIVTADVEERTETGANVVIAAGGTAITFVERFNVIPSLSATAQSVAGAARFATYENLSTTGATIRVFNSAGTDVGGTVNWLAIGA